jgi:hypothetical protein
MSIVSNKLISIDSIVTHGDPMSCSILTICACVHLYVQEFRASGHMMRRRLVDRHSVGCLLCLGVDVGPLPCRPRSAATVQWGRTPSPNLTLQTSWAPKKEPVSTSPELFLAVRSSIGWPW